MDTYRDRPSLLGTQPQPEASGPLTSVVRESLRSLVAITAGDTNSSVYCFHALSGSVAPYGDVATQLGRAHAVYGLQSIGLVDPAIMDRSVLDMAYRYAREIAERPAPGRVLFLGYSLGGVLAMETARLLANLLDQAPTVVAVDADPEYRSPHPDSAWSILVHQVLNLDCPVAPVAAAPRAQALLAVRTAAAAQRKLPSRFSLDRLGRMLDVCAVNERAAADYRPQPYPDTLVSLRSGGRPRRPADVDSWRPFVAGLVVQHLPGDHQSIMSRSNCVELANRVRSLLTPAAGH
jgi:thioesterase domain-containing protein